MRVCRLGIVESSLQVEVQNNWSRSGMVVDGMGKLEPERGETERRALRQTSRVCPSHPTREV